ncbi:calmodulin-alpha-like isoform X1 [Actinia tenebrosa]|uniref:Calmodulin-alpha-like isoform X1 n=2 Tax=Actinia tenebrosa TaxID=6105 RepID=A0A6P8ITM7_ACTTE|nr:calmodulin-alpha-like isoform X1 [Actinia tenebrosa]
MASLQKRTEGIDDRLLSVMNKLTEEQIKEYEDAFNFFDKDKNGYITTRELGAIMRSLGQNPTEVELQEMVNEVDYDGNGVVDFHEFVNMMINQNNNTLDQEELLEAFRTFDGDDKGYIFTSEIRYVLRHMGENISEQVINDILKDSNHGKKRKVTFEEFEKMVKPEL